MHVRAVWAWLRGGLISTASALRWSPDGVISGAVTFAVSGHGIARQKAETTCRRTEQRYGHDPSGIGSVGKEAVIAVFVAATLAFASGADAGGAAVKAGKALPGEACRIGTDDVPAGWSLVERWAWKEVCEGRPADFNKLLGENLDPRNPDDRGKWSDGRRTLGADFLQAILLHDPFRRSVPDRGVWIVGALFEEDVRLDDAVLERPLALHGSRFDALVSLSRVRTPGLVSFNGSRIEGKLDMDSARVGGHLMMKQAEFVEVRLAGARTDGQLAMDGSTFGGPLQMDHLDVGGSLHMKEASFSEVRMRAGRTGGRLAVVGSTFGGVLDMERINVGESLIMGRASFADVRLTGATIVGQISIASSDFGGMLTMGSMTVGESVHAGNGSIFEGVVLRGTSIGAQLALTKARFKGPLEMDGVTVGESMYLQDSRFTDALLDGARVRGQLVVTGTTVEGSFRMNSATVVQSLYITDGSTFDGPLAMDSVEVGGSLYMRRSAFAEVQLGGANIEGQAWLEESTFSGLLQMDAAAVKGNLYMRQSTFASVRLSGASIGQSLYMSDGATFAEAVLRGAEIGDRLVLIGSNFSGPLNMDTVTIGGRVLMGRARFQGVNLLGARTGDGIELDRSTFDGPLNMDSANVGGSLFMREGVFNGRVVLVHAIVGANLDAGGGTFVELDLSGARIAKELRLGSTGLDIRWKRTGDGGKTESSPKLSLLNASAGIFLESRTTWSRELEWELDGFTYARLGGLSATASELPFERGGEWFVEWLAGDDTFSPQPYRQLAEVLRRTGHDPLADEVLYALKDRIRRLDSTAGWQKALLVASWAFLGYGYRVWVALVWFCALVLVGLCVLCGSAAGRERGLLYRLFFSLGSAVPVVGLTRMQEKLSMDLTPRVDMYFVCHRIFGLIIVSVLLAGMTGLVS